MAAIDLTQVSVVIPVIGDQQQLNLLLQDLAVADFYEILIACGDESDYKVDQSERTRVIRTGLGRGIQIAQAIAQVKSTWIWILHADTRLTKNVTLELKSSLTTCRWGAFRAHLENERWPYKMISYLMNVRSEVTSIFTGDQGLFIKKELLQECEGFPAIPLLEDVECSKRLRRLAKPQLCDSFLQMSVRRWEDRGIWTTVLESWLLRTLYFMGVNPARLANIYYRTQVYK